MCSRMLAVDLRYWRTLLAAVRWLVKWEELYRESAATANEISGRGASAAYINEPTIAWQPLISLSLFAPQFSARSSFTLRSIGVDIL